MSSPSPPTAARQSSGSTSKPSSPNKARQNTKRAKKSTASPSVAPESAPAAGAAEAAALPTAPQLPTFRQGDRCMVGEHCGIVQYVGAIKSLGPGLWVGVQYDDPVGACNGRVGKKRFFVCPKDHGGFHRPSEIAFEPGSQPDTAAASAPTAAAAAAETSKPPSPDTNVAGQKRKTKRGASSSGDGGGGDGGGVNAADPLADLLAAMPLPPTQALASKCEAAGRGLHTAVVKQEAQFVITACDAAGLRRAGGGDAFAVAVRGVRPNPQLIRARVHDLGNGTSDMGLVLIPRLIPRLSASPSLIPGPGRSSSLSSRS